MLLTSDGGLVDEDTLEDSVPIVQVTTSGVAEYVVRVGMVTCTIEPCGYGFGVYGR